MNIQAEKALGISYQETKDLNIALRALGVTQQVSAIRESSKLVVEVVPDIQSGHVNSLRSFNLEKADLEKVFSAFGETEIEVHKPGVINHVDGTQSYGAHAIVGFADALAAVAA